MDTVLQVEYCDMDMDMKLPAPQIHATRADAASKNWYNADSVLLVKAYAEIEKSKERMFLPLLSCFNF